MTSDFPTVSLRAPHPDDAQTIVEVVHASLDDLSKWMPWATKDYDLVAARAWIRGEFGDLHRFVIEIEGVFVGCCSLNQIDTIHRRANLGYWVCTAHNGRGYATAATKLLARFALGLGDLERVEIVAAVDNVASRRVAEKSGAKFEGIARRRIRQHGVMHDACVFSVVSGDVVASVLPACSPGSGF